MANVYESIEKSMLPVEYLPDDYEGPNAGTVDQIVGAYFFCTYIGLVVSKPVFGVSDKARLKPAC